MVTSCCFAHFLLVKKKNIYIFSADCSTKQEVKVLKRVLNLMCFHLAVISVVKDLAAMVSPVAS